MVDVFVVSFFGNGHFIIDVLEGECCLTAKENIIYVYDEEDYLEVVQDVLEKVKEFIQGG